MFDICKDKAMDVDQSLAVPFSASYAKHGF